MAPPVLLVKGAEARLVRGGVFLFGALAAVVDLLGAGGCLGFDLAACSSGFFGGVFGLAFGAGFGLGGAALRMEAVVRTTAAGRAARFFCDGGGFGVGVGVGDGAEAAEAAAFGAGRGLSAAFFFAIGTIAVLASGFGADSEGGEAMVAAAAAGLVALALNRSI